MAAFYNELDAFPAAWLRNLIERGHLPPGHVDTRSVVDIEPDDLEGFEQAHFFAGIGGWGYALRLAGVPADARLWTGSCPCQPFSAAGKYFPSADTVLGVLESCASLQERHRARLLELYGYVCRGGLCRDSLGRVVSL